MFTYYFAIPVQYAAIPDDVTVGFFLCRLRLDRLTQRVYITEGVNTSQISKVSAIILYSRSNLYKENAVRPNFYIKN